jgi:hypothetical protein
MKTMLHKFAAVALAATLVMVLLAAQAFAATILSESFETPEQAGISWNTQKQPAGWGFSGVQRFLIDTVDWPVMGTPPDGTQFETVYAGYIWTNTGVQIALGTTYTLTAWTNTELPQTNGIAFGLYAANDNTSLGINVGLGVYPSGGRGTPWIQRTVTYTGDSAHAGQYLAVLLGDNGLGQYACYDKVSITTPDSVPEPSSLVAMAIGGLGLIPALRRRRS